MGVIAPKSRSFQPKMKLQPIFALGEKACWPDFEYILIATSRKFEMMIQKVLSSDNEPVQRALCQSAMLIVNWLRIK